MHLFEIRYRPHGDWVKIQGEEFEHEPGPAREAFFEFVESEGLACQARVKKEGFIIEERSYDHEQ